MPGLISDTGMMFGMTSGCFAAAGAAAATGVSTVLGDFFGVAADPAVAQRAITSRKRMRGNTGFFIQLVRPPLFAHKTAGQKRLSRHQKGVIRHLYYHQTLRTPGAHVP